MSLYNKHRHKIKFKFNRLMKEFQDLFYYGSTVDRWLPEVILLPFVTIQWKQDPTWYRIIAPPGSGKSRHLSLFDGFELSYVVDEFTPKSFVSGFRGSGGEDPSKLPDFDGKVIIITDESTLMEQRQEDRNTVQSILRKAYDGKLAKNFGNLKETQEYTAHFNLLVGSTPTIDRYFLFNQALGERYMNFRLQIPNRRRLAEVAYENQFKDFKTRYEKLQQRVHRFLRFIPDVDISEVKVPKQVQNHLIDCADFVALVRTRITRDASGQFVTTLPQAESAGRLVQQMTQTAIADAILRGDATVSSEHINKAVYFGGGSVIAVITFILHHILLLQQEKAKKSEEFWFSAQEIVIRSGLGRRSVSRIIEDLAIHQVLDIRQGHKQGGRLLEYSISEEVLDMIRKIELFQFYIPPCKKILSMKQKDQSRLRGNKPSVRKRKRKMKTKSARKRPNAS